MKTTIALALALFASSALAEPITKIEWSDGDSGKYWTQYQSEVKFRLANYDAPETTWRAKCRWELEMGAASKGWMRGFTERAIQLGVLETGKSYGPDRYGREVLDLVFKGRDLATFASQQGYLRPWPHKGSRALTKKPDWCYE